MSSSKKIWFKRLGFNGGWAFDMGLRCNRDTAVITLGWFYIRLAWRH